LSWKHERNRTIRVGDWKLVTAGNNDWERYDLANDRVETYDLAAIQPNRVKVMADQCKFWARRSLVIHRNLKEK